MCGSSTEQSGRTGPLPFYIQIRKSKQTHAFPLHPQLKKNRIMEDVRTPDPHQNPHHPFEEPGCYRAFEEGWGARRDGQPRISIPYPLSQPEKALSWLDGWTAADRGNDNGSGADTRTALPRGA